jgi:hypothetical protein
MRDLARGNFEVGRIVFLQAPLRQNAVSVLQRRIVE